ncbi:MAG: hypothetical protein KUG67_01730 [Proteobacteria bacterium]|nr:hypothetical protein [Pseudomonadota bacterium]
MVSFFEINPPGFVAQVVAFVFGLAASSFFPVMVLGIFWKRMNNYGAISGMITGINFTAGYIIFFKFISPEPPQEIQQFVENIRVPIDAGEAHELSA